MKLPEKIPGPYKIRAAKMIKMYLHDGKTMEEIGEVFGLSRNRVGQILYKNRDLLEADRRYEKAKRINWLKRQLVKRGDTNRDALDVHDALRTEIEGKESASSSSGETRVIIIRETSDGGNKDQSRAVSGQVSVHRV